MGAGGPPALRTTEGVMRRTFWIALLGTVPWLLAGTADPGLLLELDRDEFSLRARDLAIEGEEPSQWQAGPVLQVVLGSPAHPTPAGEFPLRFLIRNPGWSPGAIARDRGASAAPPSSDGPLGVGKLPFAQGGEIALHGGADPLLLGKPASLGCVRATDADLLELIRWLESRGALHPAERHPDGELHQWFRRPARVRVR